MPTFSRVQILVSPKKKKHLEKVHLSNIFKLVQYTFSLYSPANAIQSKKNFFQIY